MSSLANNIATRFQVSTAACAIAATAVIIPAAAHAAPLVPAPTAPVTQIFGPGLITGPAGFATDYHLFYFGSPNPVPSPTVTIFEFQPFVFFPGFSGPFRNWFRTINRQFCAFGFSVRIGPYGKITASYSIKGCP